MPDLPTFVRYLSIAGPIAAGVLLLRLWSEGLIRRYRWFAFYLSWLLLELAVSLSVNRQTSPYFIVFVVVDSVIWIAQTMIVLELFSLVMQHYPGIRRSGRRFIRIASVAAVAGAFVLSLVASNTVPSDYVAITRYLLISRVIASTLLVFLFLILGFLLYFPVQLSRNVVLYAIGYSIYFTSRALTRIAGSLGPSLLDVLSAISMSVVLACLLMWILLLNRKGEHVELTVGHRWSPEQAGAAVRHLNSLNATLLKVGRK